MTYALLILAALAIGYECLVRWQMSRSVAERYNHVVALWLRKLTPRMQCISLWRTAYLADRYKPLSVQGWLHERWHIEHHWAKNPRLFPILYLIDIARRGYDGSWYENDARRAAGEPER